MSPRISAMDSDDSEDEGFQQPVCSVFSVGYLYQARKHFSEDIPVSNK